MFLQLFSCSGSLQIESNKVLYNDIIEYEKEHGEIIFDNIIESWDYVVIDSAYHIQSALNELDVLNAKNIEIQHDDTIFVVFVLKQEIVTYTIVYNTEKNVFGILQLYLYQNNEETYLPKTKFTK